MYSKMPKKYIYSNTYILFTSNNQISRAVESRMAPWLDRESTTAPTALVALTTLLLNYVGKSTLTFTHSGQFLFIYFWLSMSGMPLFLIMKNCFRLFIFRLTVWWRFIDPGIKVQAGKNWVNKQLDSVSLNISVLLIICLALLFKSLKV